MYKNKYRTFLTGKEVPKLQSEAKAEVVSGVLSWTNRILFVEVFATHRCQQSFSICHFALWSTFVGEMKNWALAPWGPDNSGEPSDEHLTCVLLSPVNRYTC